ncbi:Uncharacterised protein [Mycobacterium tuberculosis]|nr:Uncharacterised protein [Mycobacterium tuberculosis]
MSLWKCRWISGNATLTIVESRKARKAPKAATSSTAEEEGWRRRVSGACTRRRRLLGPTGPAAMTGAALLVAAVCTVKGNSTFLKDQGYVTRQRRRFNGGLVA